MACIKSVTYSFLHNGVIFGEVEPQRGIRQGDPISSYIYILCAEGLSSILRRHEEVGLLHGISIARRHLIFRISYLQMIVICFFARMLWKQVLLKMC